MSRFLFATLGSLGDLHPYIAVARALAERGHQAAIATAEDYRADVEGAGIEFAPVRPSMSELGDYRTLVTKLFDVRRGPEYLLRELVMPHLRSAYEHLLQASAGADLLISHPLAVTLPLVAHGKGLVTGPEQPEGLPEGVRAFPYLPYSMVFARAAAVVHQAGIGTLVQAMRAGCPQLIVPVSFDQPDNARRAAALGLARVLPFRKVTARRLAWELAALLTRAQYAQNARAVAEALANTDGAACAADELVACLHRERLRTRTSTAFGAAVRITETPAR